LFLTRMSATSGHWRLERFLCMNLRTCRMAKEAAVLKTNSETVGLSQPFKEVKGVAITIDDVRQIALSLPKTVEAEHWDKPSFQVNGKIYAVVQKDGVSVVVKTTTDEREALTTLEPEIYSAPANFQRLHYMIVNTERIRKDDFRSVLVRAWRLVASKRIVKAYDEQQST